MIMFLNKVMTLMIFTLDNTNFKNIKYQTKVSSKSMTDSLENVKSIIRHCHLTWDKIDIASDSSLVDEKTKLFFHF